MIEKLRNWVELKERNGQAAAFIIGLVVLFVVSLLWIIFSRVFETLFPAMEQFLVGSQFQNTYDLIIMAWNNWPLMILVGIGIYWIVNSQKQEPVATQY